MHPRAARVVAAISALFWLVPFFGLTDLLVVIVNDPDWRESYLLELGWGLLYSVLVAAPLVVLAARPRTGVAVAQLVAVAVAVAGAAVWARYPVQLLPAAAVAGNAAVLAGLAGVRARGLPLDPWLRGLAVVAAFGGGAYAAAMMRAFPHPRPDITLGLDHHPMQAALGLAIATVAAVGSAAVGGDAPLWRLPVWCSATAAGVLGVGSLLYPDVPGSAGTGLGWAALGWAVAFGAVGEWRGRRTTGSGRRPEADL